MRNFAASEPNRHLNGHVAPSEDRAVPIVELRDVDVTYPTKSGVVHALTNINLQMHDHSFTCVVGRSGCGKTTLLGLIAGYLHPTRGAALLRGEPIIRCGRDRGVVFQNTSALLPWLTVNGNIELGLKIAGIPSRTRQTIVSELLTMLGLEDFGNHRIYELSGGMQQRVAIGRALANQPTILLMDEPFGALDALTRTMLQRELRTIWLDRKFTCLFITHNVEEALILGTEVIVVSGRPGSIRARVPVPQWEAMPEDERREALAQMEQDLLKMVMSE